MVTVLKLVVAFVLAGQAGAPAHVSFPTEDSGTVSADVYGHGNRGVVLVHGGRFTKDSWAKQARVLADAGYKVVAIDLRGFGESRGPGHEDIYTAPHHLDVLAAVRYLRLSGATSVAVVGGSLGGGAASNAAIQRPADIDRVVLLAAEIEKPEQLRTPALFIVARDDTSGDGPRLPRIRAAYEKVPAPKELIIVDGNAHAQFLFETDQAERVMREILRFLSAR